MPERARRRIPGVDEPHRARAPHAQRLLGWTARNTAELTACACAVAWFYYLGYGPTLWPTHIEWMYRDDWSAYLARLA